MRVVEYFCDRCNTPVMEEEIQSVYLHMPGRDHQREVQLCPQCFGLLLNWLELDVTVE